MLFLQHQTIENMSQEKKPQLGGYNNPEQDHGLFEQLQACKELCYDYNHLRPALLKEREAMIRRMLGRTGEHFRIEQPFYCDYGFNIEIGDHFFSNFNCVILDEAKVHFGQHVFIGPNCGFYTAIHPLDAATRNTGVEYSAPITVGDNVWIGGGVTVLPGVSIGHDSVVGAGSVVTKNVPPLCVVAGNPCRIIRRLSDTAE